MGKLLMGVITLLILVMTIYSASALVIVKPKSGQMDICGTYNFSATLETATSIANVTFFWNNSGTYVRLCGLTNESTTPKLFLNESYSCSASSTLITGTYPVTIIAYGYDLATAGTAVEFNISNLTEVDNTGPVLTFTANTTADNANVETADLFGIYLTTNEAMNSLGYVRINSKDYALNNYTPYSWYYKFSAGDIPTGAYTYTVVPGGDNTTCGTTGATPLSRSIQIGGRPSSVKAGAVSSAVSASRAAVTQAVQSTTTSQKQLLALGAAAVAVYILFFYNKGHR